MPAKTKKQQRFFGAELARKKKGLKTKTGLSKAALKKWASRKK